jgi:hypothetical protein
VHIQQQWRSSFVLSIKFIDYFHGPGIVIRVSRTWKCLV